MPPWLPEPGEFPIVGERRLRDDQIHLIEQWVKGGKVEGNPADLPKAPVFPEGWQSGRPDVVLTPERAYTLRPGTEDVYRNLVLHTALKADAYVRAVEFKTNTAPIHHAVIRVDPAQAARHKDGQDGQPGFDGMSWQGIQDPEGQFIGWAPGRGPIVSPESMPWRLERGADLVVELHMLATDVPRAIQPTVALFFTDQPPTSAPLTLKMGSRLIDLPAGQRDHVITDTYELPVPFDLISVYPHAHYLATEMRVSATLPDGAVKSLLYIKHWSFHWQQDYRFVTPVALPAGTTLTMRHTTTRSRTTRTHHPPVRVQLGPQSTDDGGAGPAGPAESLADVATLVSRSSIATSPRTSRSPRRACAVAQQRRIPAFLGSSLIEVGRFADAIPHLQAAIRLDGRSAPAHNDLGTALMEQGQLADALAEFQRAIAITPTDENMFFNLGNALTRASRFSEAAGAYQRAITINPDFPDAANLAPLHVYEWRLGEPGYISTSAVPPISSPTPP